MVSITGGNIVGITNGGQVFGGYTQQGDANYNTVSISSGHVQNYIVGGYSLSGGGASYNTVALSGDAVISNQIFPGANDPGIIGSGLVSLGNGNVSYNKFYISGNAQATGDVRNVAATGDATYNTFVIEGGRLSSISGSIAFVGNSQNNSVFMTGGTVTSSIASGWASNIIAGEGGDVSNNTVTIGGTGHVGGGVWGGWTDNVVGTGYIHNNTVTIQDSAVVAGGVYGGNSAGASNTNFNSIYIGGNSIVSDGVYGGNTAGATNNANGNNVVVSGGSVIGGVYGGWAGGSGSVMNNVVTVSGNSSLADSGLYGGWTRGGSAISNVVTILGTPNLAGSNLYGGWADAGDAKNNAITISENSNLVGSSLYGGWAGGSGNVMNNVVTVSGNPNLAGSGLYGGRTGGGNASSNVVAISGTPDLAGSNLYGGWADGSGSANNNVIAVSGGSNLIGSSLSGGWADAGDAMNNAVTISENSNLVGASLYGGWAGGSGNVMSNVVTVSGNPNLADSGLYGGRTRGGNASSNVVTISGTPNLVGSSLSGGWADGGGSAIDNAVTISGTPNLAGSSLYGGRAGSGGSAINNVVTISGNPNLIGSNLYGGLNIGGGRSLGNTLNLNGFSGKIQSVQNFQRYNFQLPVGTVNGDTILSVSGRGDISNATIGAIYIPNANTPLEVGDRITLISTKGGLTSSGINETVQGFQGSGLIYNFGLPTDANNLYATLNSVYLHPQTQALPEGQAARLAFINQGADLLADTLQDENLVKSPREDWSVFTKLSGSSLRYNTGSHIDVQGSSLLAGLAKGFDMSAGVLTLGGFFEAGWGDYTSRNQFSDSSMVRGKGNTDYQGVGVLGRFDFGNGLYAEGSLRAGRSKVDFKSYDFSSSSAEIARYDSSSPYYGLHAGIGYLWSFTDTSKVDVSTKYLWNHQEGDSVRVLGDKVEFKGADSQRWRTGVKYLYTANEILTPYIGLAYEYEFDGKVNASIYNQNIDAPSLKGSTVIGELGLGFKPKDVKGLALGLAVQGYSGKSEGIGSRLQAVYEF